MGRRCEPCAEPGCERPAQRGSYCSEHGARYYMAARGTMMSAEHIQKLDAGPDLGVPGSALAQIEDRVRLHLRAIVRNKAGRWE